MTTQPLDTLPLSMPGEPERMVLRNGLVALVYRDPSRKRRPSTQFQPSPEEDRCGQPTATTGQPCRNPAATCQWHDTQESA